MGGVKNPSCGGTRPTAHHAHVWIQLFAPKKFFSNSILRVVSLADIFDIDYYVSLEGIFTTTIHNNLHYSSVIPERLGEAYDYNALFNSCRKSEVQNELCAFGRRLFSLDEKKKQVSQLSNVTLGDRKVGDHFPLSYLNEVVDFACETFFRMLCNLFIPCP